uniref:ribosomal protein L35 n=1 Tax=Ahnfeltia fastigiata TaxID=31363 RepID=UPI001D12C201|nr:ribosomal protein L35 [Ahnfeltia fastigiata]UAT97690.1 ribosomal protein L35 [Ahnfeltia fastigiata]UAT97894.1 ribosomal protein L35 [Ahnfeltia fastigiata]
MYKLKTSKSIMKRFKITSTGKLLRHQSSRSHLLQKKSPNRKKQLSKVVIVNKRDYLNFRQKLPYTLR